ncbi:MAG TPA: MopE-related protein, partial [Polyangiaceae bacterium LLY-WYZ-15_(1-7)]|nr:MopE-related protein [Polyangiaceae bacterium LLY-WYZ-15_(1-7)]
DDTDEGRAPGRHDGCDGRDDDCDGETDEDALAVAFYVDLDGDGAGGMEPVLACLGEAGVGAFPSDCDDADDARYPGAPELCDGVDNDCDEAVDEGDDASLCDVPNASGSCVDSACVLACDEGFLDCDGDPLTGCEVDPASDAAHCGGCGSACEDAANATVSCVDSSCVLSCEPGFEDCEGGAADGCEANLMSDPRNCGACRARCEGENAAPMCVAGACELACLDGWEDCDGEPGCETWTGGDPANCGGCGMACPGALDACVAGMCRGAAFESDGSDGAFAPDTDMVLPAGVYEFTSVDIPAGVTVTTDGSGVLEIHASGDIVVNGTIDVSGGDGGEGDGQPDICGGGAGGGDTGNALGDGPSWVDGAGEVCPGGGAGGMGGFGGGSTERPSHTAGCDLASYGGRRGGGAGGQEGFRQACETSPGGGGGYAGGAGGSGCWSETEPLPGGAGASVAGLSTGGSPAATNCGGGGGGEPGLGAYAGEDGQTGQYQSILPRAGGGGGGSIGADAAADLAVTTTFRPGSGGGGGGATTNGIGGAGGGGGGALRLASATRVLVSGRLLARGGRGGDGAAGAGGGGSGGVIYVAAPEVRISGEASTAGGNGGVGGPRDFSNGGAGGIGRIRISAVPERCTLVGTFVPAAADVGCSPTVPAIPERVYVDVYPF